MSSTRQMRSTSSATPEFDIWRPPFDIGTLRIGIHTSISQSLENAALKAADLGANTFQIFSTSPRMWRASVPAADDILRLRRVRKKFACGPW